MIFFPFSWTFHPVHPSTMLPPLESIQIVLLHFIVIGGGFKIRISIYVGKIQNNLSVITTESTDQPLHLRLSGNDLEKTCTDNQL